MTNVTVYLSTFDFTYNGSTLSSIETQFLTNNGQKNLTFTLFSLIHTLSILLMVCNYYPH